MIGSRARRVRHLRPVREVDSEAPRADGDRAAALSVEITHEGRRCVITPTGDLDLSTAGALDAVIRAAEAGEARRITVDLSELTLMDTSGLHVLLKAAARSEADGHRLRLVRGSSRVHSVFELTNTVGIMPFVDKA